MGFYENLQMLGGRVWAGLSGRNADLVREQLSALNDGQFNDVTVNLSTYDNDFDLSNLIFNGSNENVQLSEFVQSLAQDAGTHDATFLGQYDFGDMLIGTVSVNSTISVVSDGNSAEVFLYTESVTGKDLFNNVPGSSVQEGADAPITYIEGHIARKFTIQVDPGVAYKGNLAELQTEMYAKTMEIKYKEVYGPAPQYSKPPTLLDRENLPGTIENIRFQSSENGDVSSMRPEFNLDPVTHQIGIKVLDRDDPNKVLAYGIFALIGVTNISTC